MEVAETNGWAGWKFSCTAKSYEEIYVDLARFSFLVRFINLGNCIVTHLLNLSGGGMMPEHLPGLRSAVCSIWQREPSVLCLPQTTKWLSVLLSQFFSWVWTRVTCVSLPKFVLSLVPSGKFVITCLKLKILHMKDPEGGYKEFEFGRWITVFIMKKLYASASCCRKPDRMHCISSTKIRYFLFW